MKDLYLLTTVHGYAGVTLITGLKRVTPRSDLGSHDNSGRPRKVRPAGLSLSSAQGWLFREVLMVKLNWL